MVATVASPPAPASASPLDAQWLQRVLKFRYSTPASSFSSALGCFHILLYSDAYGASLSAISRVMVLLLQPLSLHCLVGQTSTAEVLVRDGLMDGIVNAAGNSMVQLVTSHPSEVTFTAPMDQPFPLSNAAMTRLRFNITPSATTSTLSTASTAAARKHAVFLLNARTKAILQGWWVNSSSSLPAISRAYTIPLRVGQRADKRIPYTNDWSEPKGYRVLSSDPKLVAVKAEGTSNEFIIPAHSRGMIRLSIGPIHALGRAEVLLFVNNSNTGANEDCLLLNIDVGV